MSTYVDANALLRLYLQLPGHEDVLRELTGKNARPSWPFPVTDLLRLEVVNGVQRMLFECRSEGPWRVTPESAQLAMAQFEHHLDAGDFLRRSPLALVELEGEFVALAMRHTPTQGFRTYDLLHVASAVELGARRFVSFDNKANALARIVGMDTV